MTIVYLIDIILCINTFTLMKMYDILKEIKEEISNLRSSEEV